MEKFVVYSFDPHSEFSTEAEVQAETRSRRRAATRLCGAPGKDDSYDEMNRQVADIMAATRPLRMRA